MSNPINCIHFFTAVWGKEYIDSLINRTLPSLDYFEEISNEQLLFKYHIYSDIEGIIYLKEKFSNLNLTIEIIFYEIEDKVLSTVTVQKYFQINSIRYKNQSNILIIPDVVYFKNIIKNWIDQILQGKKFIYSLIIQTSKETIENDLNLKEFDFSAGNIQNNFDKKIVIKNLHPLYISKIIGSPIYSGHPELIIDLNENIINYVVLGQHPMVISLTDISDIHYLNPVKFSINDLCFTESCGFSIEKYDKYSNSYFFRKNSDYLLLTQYSAWFKNYCTDANSEEAKIVRTFPYDMEEYNICNNRLKQLIVNINRFKLAIHAIDGDSKLFSFKKNLEMVDLLINNNFSFIETRAHNNLINNYYFQNKYIALLKMRFFSNNSNTHNRLKIHTYLFVSKVYLKFIVVKINRKIYEMRDSFSRNITRLIVRKKIKYLKIIKIFEKYIFDKKIEKLYIFYNGELLKYSTQIDFDFLKTKILKYERKLNSLIYLFKNDLKNNSKWFGFFNYYLGLYFFINGNKEEAIKYFFDAKKSFFHHPNKRYKNFKSDLNYFLYLTIRSSNQLLGKKYLIEAIENSGRPILFIELLENFELSDFEISYLSLLVNLFEFEDTENKSDIKMKLNNERQKNL